jgi:hypothetical protein
MQKLLLILILILNGIIFFNACKKESEEPLEYDTQTSQDNSLAEGTFNDVASIANQAIENGTLSTFRVPADQNSLLSNCAVVTVNADSSGGGTIVVDFGQTNCLCFDSRFRRGKINIIYSGSYRDSGSVISTSFDNYFVGKDSAKMFQVTGSKMVINNGRNSSGNMNFTIQVDGHLMNRDGLTMDWTSQRNREWISGESTPLYWMDDEYVITGSANGFNFTGIAFSATITKGLHIEYCPYITEGAFELTPDGKPTRTLNYGNGSCDASAVLSISGTDFPIVLR